MMKTILFIVNPRSGRGAVRTKLLDIIDIFIKAEYDLTIYITQAAGDARIKAKEASEYYDAIVCSGGDGTLDEVVCGVMEGNRQCRVGYIPAGSTNDFANSLSIPKDMIKAAENVVKWEEFPCDIGCFNDDYFVYVAAFGLFSDVSYDTPQDMKNALGHMAYLLQGVLALTAIKTFNCHIEANEMEISGEFIYGMVTNSTSVGGFKNLTGRDVKLDDGEFEVTLVRKPTNILELNEIIAAALAMKPDDKYFYQFSTSQLKISFDREVPWSLDGEFGGAHENVEVVNAAHALTLLV